MDRKDTFQTITYKGQFIHLCRNRTTGKEEIRVQWADYSQDPRMFRTLHAAKCAITRKLLTCRK